MSQKANVPEFQLPKLFTVDQVAGFTQFSTKQVRRWIKSGALKATRLGRHLRVAENDLALFLAGLGGRKPSPSMFT
jgi:excisionase family DNA binding protein